jgi:protein-L-isoaspartate(D-aspartate) O-methyltransferase
MLTATATTFAVALGSCSVNSGEPEAKPKHEAEQTADVGSEPAALRARADERDKMVREQIEARGVRDPKVLAAMRAVPRHELVAEEQRSQAYEDRPLPIGQGQTISQPYIVAAMTELLDLQPGERVLEVGTGSGYQAAVLAELGVEVYSIEIVESLGRRAAEDLERLGYRVNLRIGDGYRGWPEAAPFDAIVVTAAPEEVPPLLIEQLKVGGRLVIPVGSWSQELVLLRKEEDGVHQESVAAVRFVPMTGEARH